MYATTSPIWGSRNLGGIKIAISPDLIAGAIEPVKTTRAFTYPVTEKAEKLNKIALRRYPRYLVKFAIFCRLASALVKILSGGACTNNFALLGAIIEGVIKAVCSPKSFEIVRRTLESV